MTEIVAASLALGSGAIYGAADFLGGIAARRSTALAAVIWSQCVGLVLLSVALVVLPPATVAGRDIAWGAASGVIGAIAIVLLYHALAIGRMSIVAPVTAVCGMAIPVIVGLALGERPGILPLSGVALALVAVMLVSQEPATAHEPSASGASPTHESHRRALLVALASGVAIGFFLIGFARASHAAGLWPVLAARAASLMFLGIGSLVRRAPLRITRPVWPFVAGAGVFDMTGNVAYVLALGGGLLSVVATLVSLYPASTVLLARVVLGERLRVVQLAGLAVACGAVGLMAWR